MINIAELLKDIPMGMKLYSPLFGEVMFKYITASEFGIVVEDAKECYRSFDKYGRYFTKYNNSECLLFPSKDCRTWEVRKMSVEPKFKVGDWIVRGEGFVYEPSLITEIRDYYVCELLNGERVTYTLNDVHKNFHLWTIEDAKDGDILISENGNPFIFCEGGGYDDDYDIFAYGGLNKMGEFYESNRKTSWTYRTSLKPATKEQRDLLFAKLRELGYEWDANKKELHKIIVPKFKVGDDIKTGSTIETIAEVGYVTRSYLCESGRTIQRH